MNHDKARQIQDGPNAGKWHFTTANDGHIYPTGYCGAYLPCSNCGGVSAGWPEGSKYDCATCYNTGAVVVPVGARCKGHDTPEGAYAHQKAYQLDHRLWLDRKLSGEQRPCRVCGEWTQGVAQVGAWWTAVLCDEHRTREHVEALFDVGESWHS